MGKLLKMEERGAISVLTLSNPPLNLLCNALKEELLLTFSSMEAKRNIRVVILTGEGERAFCAGADMSEFERRIEDSAAGATWDLGHRILDAAANLPQVLIAAVNGSAFGGGLEVAMMCDIILCSEDGKIGLPEVKRGILPGNGGIERLIARSGYARALELMATGMIIAAEEALACGVVDAVHAKEALMERAAALAEEIAANPGLAVAGIKETLKRYRRDGMEAGRDAGRERFEALHRTADCLEGVRAFFEKRPPKFIHE